MLVPFLDLCSTAAGFLCQRKSSCTSLYPTCPQGILPFFICSLNSESFLLTPSINIYTGSHLILPYASLKLLFKSLSAAAVSSDTFPQCVFEDIFFPPPLFFFSFSIAAPDTLPECLLFGVVFFFLLILWFNP